MLSANSADEQFAVPLCERSFAHNGLPSFARMPIVPFWTNWTYCRTPPTSIGTADAYPAELPPGT